MTGKGRRWTGTCPVAYLAGGQEVHAPHSDLNMLKNGLGNALTWSKVKFFPHEAPIGIADNQISLNFFRKKHIFEAKSYKNCNFSHLWRQSVPQANIFSYRF